MNTFFSDQSPYVSARNLDDKRVGKMIIESGQLATACIRLTLAEHGYEEWEIDALFHEYGILTATKGTPWRLTHQNHPSSKWTRYTYRNYQWVIGHALGLINEFTKRFGKVHACCFAIVGMLRLGDELLKPLMDDSGLTEPPQCMPDEFKHDDPVIAYRAYLQSKPNVVWVRAEPPSWWRITEVKEEVMDDGR